MQKLALALIFLVSLVSAAESWNSAEILTSPGGTTVSIFGYDIRALRAQKDDFYVAMDLSTAKCNSYPLLSIIEIGTYDKHDKSGLVIIKINKKPIQFTRILLKSEPFSMGSIPQTKQGEVFLRKAFMNSKAVTFEIGYKLYTINAEGFSSAVTKLQAHCKTTQQDLKEAL